MDESQQPKPSDEIGAAPPQEPVVIRPQTSPLSPEPNLSAPPTDTPPAADEAAPQPAAAAPVSPAEAPAESATGAVPSEPAAQALVSQPVVSGGLPVNPVTPGKSKRLKFLLPVVAGFFLLLGGGAAAYSHFVLNSPSGIWKRALKTTASGFDQLVDVASQEESAGGKLSGSFKIESPSVVDGNLSGAWHGSQSTLSLDVGFSGLRPKLEMRGLPASEGASPDIYVKLSDLAGFESLFGSFDPAVSDMIGEINNSWYVIDHTLYEQALLSAEESQDSAVELSAEDVRDIGERTSKVLKQHLFTDDPAKAAVIVDEPIGREDFEGKATYKYRLKVQREQLKTLVTALKDSLSETKLKEIVTANTDTGSFEEALDFDQLLGSIDEADFDSAIAEAWVDMEHKFIRNIRITPTDLKEGEIGYLDFYLPYEGGSDYPFTVRVVSKDDSGEFNVSTVVNINTDTRAVKISFDVDGDQYGEKVIARGSLEVVSSDEELNIEKPADAKNIYELVGLFLGGGNLGPSNPMIPSSALPVDDFELDL